MSVITRFAPSPSGSLHIGGARTALFNYIFAKSMGGKFKIRIENTDKKKDSKKSAISILNSLKWLGIYSDEKIIYQEKNIDEHKKIVNELLMKKLAYRCYLNNEELEKLKKKRKVSKSKIESYWRDKSSCDYPKNKKYVVRIKIPRNKEIIINDLIQGKVKVKSNEIDDYVILRSDKTPTFLLSSAIDDNSMKISHIIRGDDHLTNTFRQFYIFKFLNNKLPYFAHIPLIHDELGKKLSKRDNVSSIEDLVKKGYLKEAIINYLVRLGWSFKDEDILSLDEVINLFKIDNIRKSPSKVDEKKIISLNSYYMKNLPTQNLLDILIEKISSKGIKVEESIKIKLRNIINLITNKTNNINELYDMTKFIFIDSKPNFVKEHEEILSRSKLCMPKLIKELNLIQDWSEESLNFAIKNFIDKNNLSFKDVGQPIRLSLTKSLNSPSIALIMSILGKKEVIKRFSEIW